jgi:hypothetical protein
MSTLVATAPATGDSIAAFVKSSAPPPGTPIDDAQLQILWEGIMNIIATWITTNGTALIVPSTIVTVGGPTTQTGPAVPLPLAIS